MHNKKIYKHNKKCIKLLSKSGFRQPYQLVLDSSFIYKMNEYGKRYKHLSEIFKSEPKLFFTKCMYNKLIELQTSKNKNDDTLNLSDHCEIIKCKHENKSDELKCLNFIFRHFNKNHYIVCTSSKEVMDKFKNKKDVPILNFNKGQVKLFINYSIVPVTTEYITEATQNEMRRLERIFEGDFVESSEVEQINIDDLEVSEEEQT